MPPGTSAGPGVDLRRAQEARSAQRDRDARKRLAAQIAEARKATLGAPMVWGHDDCALWCANILKHVLGRDPAARYRGRYRSAYGYRRMLEREGFGSVLALLSNVAMEQGWRLLESPAFAQIGDICIVPRPKAETVMIALGDGFWIGRSDRGFGVVRSEEIVMAWSVV